MDTSLITEDILFLPYNFISTYHSAWYLIQRDDKKLALYCMEQLRQRKANITWYHLHVGSKKKWYKWTYSQNRNRGIDVENKLMVTKVGGINWEIGIDIYNDTYKTDN